MSAKKTDHKFPFLAGGGEMGELTRTFDWSGTPVGAPDKWPQSLRTTVSIILNSKFPMFLWWGEDLICFYNDAYRPSLGNNGKHPGILGQKAEVAWPEIWSIIKPLIDQVVETGEATWSDDQLIPIYRNGKLEDVYWTFSYSPVMDESGKRNGILVTCVETTEKVESLKNLQESNDQLQFAIEATELGTFDYNPFTDKFSGNDRLKQWFGLPALAEIELSNAISAIKPADKDRVMTAISRALSFESGGEYDIEYNIIHPITKVETIVRAKGRAWFNEDKIAYRFNGTLQDITRQATYRKQVEESEERFRTMAENTDIYIAMSDESSSATYFNQAWTNLTGRSMDDLLDFGWTDLVHEGDKERYLKNYLDAFEKRIPFSGEFRIKNRDGEYRWLLAGGPPRFRSDGSFAGYIASCVDITQQKQTEEKLLQSAEEEIVIRERIEESEQRARTMVESAPFPIGVYVGKDMRIMLANQTLLNTWGKGNDVIGKKYADVLPELRNQEVFQQLDKVFSTGIPFHAQNQALDLVVSGVAHRYFLNYSFTPLRDRSGKVYGVMSTASDVTDLNNAKRRIEESERRFRNIADHAPVLIWMAGLDTFGNFFNKEWLDFTGRTVEQESGAGWMQGIHPDDLDRCLDAFSRSFQERKKLYIEYRLRRHDGEYRWLSDTAVPRITEDGMFEGFIGACMDIHDHVVSQEKVRISSDALAATAKNLQLALEAGELGLYEFDVATSGIECNAQCRQTFGWTTDEKLDNSALMKLIHPDDRAMVDEGVKFSVQNNSTYNFDYRIIMKDGSLKWIHATGVPIYSDNGKSVRISGITVDITKQKLFENELSRQVNERTKELEQKNLDLEKMNKELQSFAYVSSHDLQEPLRKIRTFATRLIEQERENLSQHGKEQLDRMQNAATRMQTLIEDLLAYSRTNNAEKKFEVTHLREVIQEVRDEMDSDLKQKNATIEATQLCDAHIIPFQFRQLMFNLVGNSLKFSREDIAPHIVISSKIDLGKMLDEPVLAAEKKYCHIVYKDNGIGFEPEYGEKIFELFQRLHARNEYNGTGIGLAIVKKIVENHKGRITAKGETDKGARFDIYLPA